MKWVCYVLLFPLCVLDSMQTMSPSEIEEFINYLEESSSLDQIRKKHRPEGRHDNAKTHKPISDNPWESSGKFEGDIILNEGQRKVILSNVVEGLARNGLRDLTQRWPNNELIYFINTEHFNYGQIMSIEDGIHGLASVSCVRFRPYQQGDIAAVVIQGDDDGCYSQVGYQGGYQILNLDFRHSPGLGCFMKVAVMHELLHALGFFHMQSNPDRDEYVDVLWDNIISKERFNFRKYNSYTVSDFGVGYDYMSVMHYDRKAFSRNGQDTLVPKYNAFIGQRIGLSEKDIIKLNIMYCQINYAPYDVEWRRKGTKNNLWRDAD